MTTHIEIEIPVGWYMMTDDEIHAWLVQRAKEKGEPAPLTARESMEELGRRFAERRQAVALKAIERTVDELVGPDDGPIRMKFPW